MTLEEIYARFEILHDYPLSNFTGNLKNLKAKIEKDKKATDFDDAAVATELLNKPGSLFTEKGYPFWNKHPAKKLFEADIKDGKCEGMKPKQIQKTRPEYGEFPKDVFRKRVQYTKRKLREAAGWVPKQNKFARRKIEEECQEMANDWEANQADEEESEDGTESEASADNEEGNDIE